MKPLKQFFVCCLLISGIQFAKAQCTPPISAVSPSLQQFSCSSPNLQTVTLTAVSPTNNVIHYVTDDSGNTVVLTGSLALFSPNATTNSYTYTLVDAATNCSATPKTFSVTMLSANSPTFNLVGTPTIGCNQHSLAAISIVNPNTNPTPGGGLQFGFIAPNGTPIIPPSPALNSPGTWTVVVKSLIDGCETRVPVTITQNTIAPNISANVPTQTLSCYTPSTVLMAQSTNTSVTYNWIFPSGVSFPSSPIIVANATTNTASASAGNYTLIVTNTDNGCNSFSVIPMMQNMFPPTASISITSSNTLITCLTPSVELSTNSKTGIPAGTGFSTVGIVQVQLWQGPLPQPTIALLPSYTSSTQGTYTLTVKDLNNGCTSRTTITIYDERAYPVILKHMCIGENNTITTMSNAIINWTSSAGETGTNNIIAFPNLGTTYTIQGINPSNGCENTVTLTAVDCSTVVGIQELSNTTQLKIYPNPVNSILNVELDVYSERQEVLIYNTLGAVIRNEKLNIENGKAEINVSELKSGIYFIKIENRTGKFLKE